MGVCMCVCAEGILDVIGFTQVDKILFQNVGS